MLAEHWQIAEVQPVEREPPVRTALKFDLSFRDDKLWAAHVVLHFDVNLGATPNLLQELLLALTKRGDAVTINENT